MAFVVFDLELNHIDTVQYKHHRKNVRIGKDANSNVKFVVGSIDEHEARDFLINELLNDELEAELGLNKVSSEDIIHTIKKKFPEYFL